jgi:hypothetical protein
MDASAWKISSYYGVRLKLEDRERHFQRHWVTVQVEVADTVGAIRLLPSFWRDCPELRGGIVQDLLQREGLLSWPHRKPHKFELTLLGGTRFRLTRKT